MLNSVDITRQAMKVLENNLAHMQFGNHPRNYSKPTRWQLTKWRVSRYFSTLWLAMKGVDLYD